MITFSKVSEDGIVIIVDGKESLANFKQLVQRGANLWPDAQPEIKELADQVTNNKILQDYRQQAKDKIKAFETALTEATIRNICSCGEATVVTKETKTYICGYCKRERTIFPKEIK